MTVGYDFKLYGTIIPAIIVTFHSLAILSTVFRLAHRYRTRRLWWDDWWAFIAVISTIALMIVYLALPWAKIIFGPISVYNRTLWTTLILFTTALWSARLSVAVTIVRLLPPATLVRRIAVGVSCCFVVFWAALLVQKIFLCGTVTVTHWVCPIPRSTGYLELATDITADLWLVLSPVYMLVHMRLPRRHKRLIMAIFTCGLFVTISSVVHDYFIVTSNQAWIGITGHFEVSTSVVVCNLIVVTTYIYRLSRNNDEDSGDAESETTAPERPSYHRPSDSRNMLTTVEILRNRTPIGTLTEIFTTDFHSLELRHQHSSLFSDTSSTPAASATMGKSVVSNSESQLDNAGVQPPLLARISISSSPSMTSIRMSSVPPTRATTL
ncbi:hypothetical protein BDQ12DRAFT_654354 [Crucibulum laeve]|uniref:Rhodopsin domain-containing protein n=1 Tax=Crucibulum laeve TaxID=68775 RepID=A0A5C3LU18_9AGAR|nr:hypothetical protein BDQ12DRAFT_654354 [Crucibulum laeve]